MYLVFDIGGTTIRLAKSLDLQTIEDSLSFPTSMDFKEAMNTFTQKAQSLTAGEMVQGAAGGVRSLDADKLKLRNQPNFPMWVDEPLKQALEDILKAPVILENDAAVAGLGEAVHGAGEGKKIVAFLTISTGVGGAKIVSGKIDDNAQGFEPGLQKIGEYDLEFYASGAGIEKRLGKKPEEIADPRAWEEIAQYLAVGLNNAAVFWSPEIFVLGGSVMKSLSLDVLEKHFTQTLTIFPQTPELSLAKLGDQAGLYGALELLKTAN